MERNRGSQKGAGGTIEIEEGSVELVQGMGFRDIILSYKLALFAASPFKRYAAAYRLGDKLVLYDPDKLKEILSPEAYLIYLVEKESGKEI